MPPPLTDRQRHFIRAFLDMTPDGGRLVATRAARIAGYAWPGKQGPRLLTMPVVAAELERRFAARLEEQDRAWRAESQRRYLASLPRVRGPYRVGRGPKR